MTPDIQSLNKSTAKPLKISLYDMQLYCHQQGFACTGEISKDKTKFRLILLKDGKEFKKAKEWIKFSDIPAAYAEKYEAIYNYLKDQQNQ